MGYKSIEIYYDIASIPGVENPERDMVKALDFRNAAMELVESKLEEAGLGEWVGAEIGMGEVNFGFEVQDFVAAETAIRAAVAGTQYDIIREITQYDEGAEQD